VTRAILTCSPHFTELALNEIRRSRPHITGYRQIAPGYILLQAPGSFGNLTHPWRNRLPIYLHHLFPVHAVASLNAAENDLAQLKRIAQEIAPSGAAVQVRSAVQTVVPYSLSDIGRVLNGKQISPSIRAPTGRILSILIAQEENEFLAYLGLSWAAHNLSPWAGGQIPITEPVSNRAGYKLLEALLTFSVRLRTGDHALDLGAAPGAWTTLLRRRGVRVTAVAPSPLYPWLALDPDVIYEAMRAEEFLGRCQTTFDLIVNDMMLDGQDSARLMVAYAQHLRREGIAIMTLKLHDRNRLRVMDHSLRILRKAYKIIRVRQLVSNGHEVTLFLRRKR
jgi:23S rRNA (cytidine2498-2'-O)-methyltransferase